MHFQPFARLPCVSHVKMNIQPLAKPRRTSRTRHAQKRASVPRLRASDGTCTRRSHDGCARGAFRSGPGHHGARN
eukprot:2266202-Alexandrium_andersonii.AAC.1